MTAAFKALLEEGGGARQHRALLERLQALEQGKLSLQLPSITHRPQVSGNSFNVIGVADLAQISVRLQADGYDASSHVTLPSGEGRSLSFPIYAKGSIHLPSTFNVSAGPPPTVKVTVPPAQVVMQPARASRQVVSYNEAGDIKEVVTRPLEEAGAQ